MCYSWVFGTDHSASVNMNNSLPKLQARGEERKNVMSLRYITWSCSADNKWETDSVGNACLNLTFSGASDNSCTFSSETDPQRIILSSVSVTSFLINVFSGWNFTYLICAGNVHKHEWVSDPVLRKPPCCNVFSMLLYVNRIRWNITWNITEKENLHSLVYTLCTWNIIMLSNLLRTFHDWWFVDFKMQHLVPLKITNFSSTEGQTVEVSTP